MIVNTRYISQSEPRAWLTFSSPESFTLSVGNNRKYWNGKLEYSVDSAETWTEWAGTSAITAGQVENGAYQILICGTGNVYLTSANTSARSWVLTGSNIRCDGNIETLLDYKTVLSGKHPTMYNYCFAALFSGNTELVSAPTLPATTLTTGCYMGMFGGCTKLLDAPELPAIVLADSCYSSMFHSCTALKAAPALPAMTMGVGSYSNMFMGCTALLRPPALPATTLALNCYLNMFYGCTNLICVPALPALHMPNACYGSMFEGCTKLKIRSTTSGVYQHAFRLPATGTGTTDVDQYSASQFMFGENSGSYIGTPAINRTYYTSSAPVE